MRVIGGDATGRTRRQRLRDLLAEHEHGLDLEELKTALDATRGVVLEDLRHLQMSLRHAEETLQVAPPTCRECAYAFNLDAPKAPSRCPICKSEDLTLPVFRVGRA